ncbi:TfuA-like protein [Legionella oakridgensis]|nr:TfuA-like protein [Legionella oakridgensis]
MHNIHVFLGPSLDLNIAREILPNAHYHPPIQCGDIIRSMRLNPGMIVIIDGLYETTAAVWHKEILFAIQAGIEVWGAASMGALRAAELHHYGMKGFGDIFHDFKEGKLSDDDEVAVLHLSQVDEFSAINDAMVNIRATCELALSKKILTLAAKNSLIAYCKAQFYPYRSLKKAVLYLSETDRQSYTAFAKWLDNYGVVDIKKNDALSLLKHIKASYTSAIYSKKLVQTKPLNSMTCFLRELILFANTTPFQHSSPWLPHIEHQLQTLHTQSPMEYMLLAEIVSFMQKLAMLASNDKKSINNEALINYIRKNQLYSPEQDFAFYENHPLLSDVYLLICQAVCLAHLTSETLDKYLPIIAHYYALPPALVAKSQKRLRVILIIIFSINQHVHQTNLTISQKHLPYHLKQLKKWRNYSHAQFKSWINQIGINRQVFTSFLSAYVSASSVHLLGMIKINYHHWLYDAYSLYFDNQVSITNHSVVT